MCQPFKSLGSFFVFRMGSKNTHFIEDIETLIPAKFRLIPLSGFRGDVQNVSANQRPGGRLVVF